MLITTFPTLAFSPKFTRNQDKHRTNWQIWEAPRGWRGRRGCGFSLDGGASAESTERDDFNGILELGPAQLPEVQISGMPCRADGAVIFSKTKEDWECWREGMLESKAKGTELLFALSNSNI